MERNLKFIGTIGEGYLNTFFASGISSSCIKKSIAMKLGAIVTMKDPVEIKLVSKNHYFKIYHTVQLDFYLNGLLHSDEFMVIPSLSEEIIIGAKTLQKWKVKLDFKNNLVITDPGAGHLKLI